jgi:hypothetical protein
MEKPGSFVQKAIAHRQIQIILANVDALREAGPVRVSYRVISSGDTFFTGTIPFLSDQSTGVTLIPVP